jgi:hypothetical protein
VDLRKEIKDYLMNNLTIEIEKQEGRYDDEIEVTLKLEDEIIDFDRVMISKD